MKQLKSGYHRVKQRAAIDARRATAASTRSARVNYVASTPPEQWRMHGLAPEVCKACKLVDLYAPQWLANVSKGHQKSIATGNRVLPLEME